MESPVEVTLEEAYHGTKRTLSLQTEEPCTSCQGSGRIQNVRCSACRGSGAVAKLKRLEMKIPPGVRDGSRVRIAGKGQPGYGGANGDLYLIISVKPHSLLERRGDDLYAEVPIPLTVAMLGGEIQVPTVDGLARLKLAPGTETGKVFRLRGKGIPNVDGYGRGDLHVRILAEVPVKLSSKQKKVLKELTEMTRETNYPRRGRFMQAAEQFFERKRKMGK